MALPAVERSERSKIIRDTGQSGFDQALTVSTSTGKVRRVLFVTVVYTGSVTRSVTIILNSGAGSEWDTILQSISLSNAKTGVWIPDGNKYILDDDVIDVLVPAGGVGVISVVAIYTKVP